MIIDEVCIHLAFQKLLVLHYIQQERNVRLQNQLKIAQTITLYLVPRTVL